MPAIVSSSVAGNVLAMPSVTGASVWKRFPKIALQKFPEIDAVLGREGLIEAVVDTDLRDIGFGRIRSRSHARRIARDQMKDEKDGDDTPTTWG